VDRLIGKGPLALARGLRFLDRLYEERPEPVELVPLVPGEQRLTVDVDQHRTFNPMRVAVVPLDVSEALERSVSRAKQRVDHDGDDEKCRARGGHRQEPADVPHALPGNRRERREGSSRRKGSFAGPELLAVPS
jgi:hypothetical protein